MAGKKAKTPKKKDRKINNKADKLHSQPQKTSSLLSSSIPGIILSIGVALWYRYQSNQGDNVVINRASGADESGQSPPFYTPTPGSWDEGYYSSPIQDFPSTHAIIFPNGGIGEPTEAIFDSEEEFISAGRLYNELGQIVQSRFHFENGTA